MIYATSIDCDVGNVTRTVLARLQATLRELALSLEEESKRKRKR